MLIGARGAAAGYLFSLSIEYGDTLDILDLEHIPAQALEHLRITHHDPELSVVCHITGEKIEVLMEALALE
jgi:hypothetical protein